jgi:hypothetical protein
MADIKTKTKKVDDAYWRAQTNIPDIYTKGRVRFAAGLREVINSTSIPIILLLITEAFMQLPADDLLELCEELGNV